MTADPEDLSFVRSVTRPTPVPLVPEVVLGVAGEVVDLWESTEERAGTTGLAPPFWAYPWAGGQALARHVLDRPALVTGRRVLDLACGSGLVGIAAARAGAGAVRAVDVDPLAVAATTVNAALNGVGVDAACVDLLDDDPGAVDVVLAGDLFYDRATAERVLPFLRRAGALGCTVLVGDPGRRHLPRRELREVSRHEVPVLAALEDRDVVTAGVWRLR